MFKIGDKVDIQYGTQVLIKLEESFEGIIVGKSTTDITQQHLVKCTDGQYPNEIYPYDTISVPLHCIEIKE